MMTIDVNAPTPRKSALSRVVSAVLESVRGVYTRWKAHRRLVLRARAAHHAAVLSAMTDDQLAGWGLKREDIHAHVYKNVPAE